MEIDPQGVKQEPIGDGGMGGTLERLLQCEKELSKMAAPAMASAEEWRSLAEERPRTGWVPQSTAPDTWSREKLAGPQISQPDCSAITAGGRTAKLPSFDGTTSWEAFHAQLTVLGKLWKWSADDAERGCPDGAAEPDRGGDGQLPHPGGHPQMPGWKYRRTRAATSQVLKASADDRGELGSISHRPGEGSPVGIC
ncbi:hypothetical protein EOD39_0900 [Acipenser ruthenus]|uniref:Uncharacterized protein n=1 Tax=Acipenser ruthenus TaxID=7906 RepID=A0A444UK53_ACIRT|nr:hypothetical protein EOD39_0900 [Acipenser ruthenus]